MKLRFNCYAKPSAPNAAAASIAYPTGNFDTMEQAREMAFAFAGRSDIMVHSIVIESMDDGLVDERWVRDADHWKREDA